jgi:hypothetical protein
MGFWFIPMAPGYLFYCIDWLKWCSEPFCLHCENFISQFASWELSDGICLDTGRARHECTVCWAGSAQGRGKTRTLVLGVFLEPKLDSKEDWM